MTRSAVTVCVVTGDDRRTTRQFLTRLAEDIGHHDNVLLVGRGGAAVEDPTAWRIPSAAHELRLVRDKLAPRPRQIVVFVEDRVELTPDWLRILVAAVEPPGVSAAAPWSNIADGDELYVGVPYRPGELGLRRSFVRDLAVASRASLRDAEMLNGPCLALRRDSLETLGGLGGALRLGYDPASFGGSARASGGRLVIAEGCYLHHPGGVTLRPDPRAVDRPFISACMIVRDEEKELPTCLASIARVADEIVVYDTGSTDRTIEIAEAAGALVTRGYWDDDFGRARNEALSRCRGQWILWVDADESLVIDDPAVLREELARASSDVEAFGVLIDNLNGTEAGSIFTHPALRLFRRALGHWDGHLHELVRARAGSPELERRLTETIRISHRGYLQSHVTGRAKAERNLRTAFGDLAGGSGIDWGLRLSSLGRSYGMAGRTEVGLAHLRRAADVAEQPSTGRLALRGVVDCLLILGRPREALEEIERLRSISADETLANSLAGSAHLALGEYDEAIELFDRVSPTMDEDGFEYSSSSVAGPKAQAMRALGRAAAAVDVLLASIRESGGVDAHVGLLVECMEQAGRNLGEIYDAVGGERAEHFVPQLLQLQPPVADRVLEAWIERDPSSTVLLAAAARVAPKLEVARQLVWSSRLRASGFAPACPLVASAADSGTAPLDRVLAASAAAALFSDPRARLVFGVSVLTAPAALDGDVRAAVTSIAPDLVTTIDRLGERGPEAAAVMAASTTRREVLIVDRGVAGLRTASIAGALARAGHGVTILQPLPAVSPAQHLMGLGVAVQGWSDSGGGSWLRASQSGVAASSAERAYDVVVVREDALALLAGARAMLPRAAFVVDLYDSARPTGAEEVDLLLSAAEEAPSSGSAAAVSFARPGSLFARQHATELEARTGLCVLGDTRTLPREEAGYFGSVIAPLLLATGVIEPIATCGDDPEGYLSRGLQAAIVAGSVTDPLPWLRAARVAIVAAERDAAEWVAAATACGTPVMLATASAGAPEVIVANITKLLRDDAAWHEAHSALGPAVEIFREDPPDVLGLLPAPVSSTLQVSRANRPVARVTLEAAATAELSEIARELGARVPGEPAPGPLVEVRVATRPDIVESLDTAAGLVYYVAWPHGGLPAEWIAPVRDCVDELWVPSSWARQCAIASGIAADRVAVVPRGVDTTRFSPDGRSLVLRTTKTTRLLYVGPCTEQAGFDAVLECYLSAFTAGDDVCLVARPIAPDGTGSSASFERELRRAAEAVGPSIEIVDGDLDGDELAELYRSCSTLLHVHRGEALASRVLEAMACGLPVIVPDDGATIDLCDQDVAWLVESRPMAITPSEWTPSKAGTWWGEPDRNDLIEAMLAVAGDPEAIKARGTAARQRVVERFAWQSIGRTATARLEQLASH